MGEAGPSAADLEDALAGLRKGWERLAIRGLGTGTAAGSSSSAGASGLRSWRGLTAEVLSAVPSCLAIPERLAPRLASRAWWRACEQGAARGAWAEALGAGAGAAEAAGGGLAAFYARQHFLAHGAAARVFKGDRGKPTAHVEMKAAGRVRASVPAAAMSDGTAAMLGDRAKVVDEPDVALMVFDVAAGELAGYVPMNPTTKHGQSLQRPLSVCSLQAAPGGRACVAAMERLVVVFTWWFGGGGGAGGGPLELQGGRCEEVRWGSGGKEVLRGATFVAAGEDAPVAVLLEGGKQGGRVDIYMRTIDTTSATGGSWSLHETVPLAPAQLSGGPRPTLGRAAPVPGTVHGSIVLWAVEGATHVTFTHLPRAQPAAEELAAGEGDLGAAAAKAAVRGGAGAASAASLFVRAMQAARKGKLQVDPDGGGAGLDMEATRWGYRIEEVDEEPGQPDLAPGDCIVSIGGQAIHGLDEETMQWRFGRNFLEGAELSIIPAEHMRQILAAETAGDSVQKTEAAPAAKEGPSRVASQQLRRRVDLGARLEAWCVAPWRDVPQLVACVDNRLMIAGMAAGDGDSRAQSIMSGVARGQWKRPVTRLALLGSCGDVLVAGLTRAVLVWRVPELVKEFSGDPELVAAFELPRSTSLAGVAVGLGLGATPFGWVTAELGGVTDSSAAIDVWRFYQGGERPSAAAPVALLAAAQANVGGDAVTRLLTASGNAADSLAAALKTAAGRVPTSTADVEGSGVGRLRAWVCRLPDREGDALYQAVNYAEQALAEAVRDLRMFVRTEGRSGSVSMAERADAAKAVSKWADGVRRSIVWPLQEAFSAEYEAGSASDDDVALSRPGAGEAAAGANPAAAGGAGGGGGAEAAAPAPAPAPAAAAGGGSSLAELRAARAARYAARAAAAAAPGGQGS